MNTSSLAAYAPGQPPAQPSAQHLSPEQRQEVQRLKAIDQKVRQHEQAHQAAGAGIAGAASYQYVRGPDGRQYAVAGEVQINGAPGATPSATIERAQRIRAAALAPADPSAQDRAVAAAAAVMESRARAELARVRREEAEAGGPDASQPGGRPDGMGAARRAAAVGAYQAESTQLAQLTQLAVAGPGNKADAGVDVYA